MLASNSIVPPRNTPSATPTATTISMPIHIKHHARGLQCSVLRYTSCMFVTQSMQVYAIQPNYRRKCENLSKLSGLGDVGVEICHIPLLWVAVG